jgi:hypothetical protein
MQRLEGIIICNRNQKEAIEMKNFRETLLNCAAASLVQDAWTQSGRQVQ